ncbi:MAG TPA: hypothetical protein VG733_02330, partial [Chthoniobacteraceae bacterium]|nr:hypothetical protein [Chthoniobacteraceae bacterium]
MVQTRFQRVLVLVVVYLVFTAISGVFIGRKMYAEHKREQGFQAEYGADWQTQYDKRFGPDSLQHA